jgi:Uncharacterized protein conserved in bacteria
MADKAFCEIAEHVKFYRDDLLQISENVQKNIYDIRLKAGQPLTICGKDGVFFLKKGGTETKNIDSNIYICTKEDLQDMFLEICGHSVFSHEEEISSGFVTLNEKYRVGISGTAVVENGRVRSLKEITSLVFRIPREVQGISNELFYKKVNLENGLLIAGEPSSGKTTFLRDLAQNLSFGRMCNPKRIALIDERFEIESIFDLGPCADVLKGCPKKEGILMALRSLSPEMIICDEISSREIESIKSAIVCGVPVIGTIHAGERDLHKEGNLKEILKAGAFETVIFLADRNSPGTIQKIYRAGGAVEAFGSNADYTQWADDWIQKIAESAKKRKDAA